jgi:hypothetical protein
MAPGAIGKIASGIVLIMVGFTIAISCTSGSWCPAVTLEEALRVLADWMNNRGSLMAGALLFIVGGLLRLYSGVRKTRMVKDSKSWPTVTGKVLFSHLHREKTSIEVAESAWIKADIYEARIAYQYSVFGTKYTSHKVCLSPIRNVDQLEDAKKIIDKYPADSNVTVYYDPTNPSRAILESRDEDIIYAYRQAIALLGFGTFLLITMWL